MSPLTKWILVSLALTIGLTLIALVVDQVAEKLSKKAKPRRIVRQILLIEASERVADFMYHGDLRKLVLWSVGSLAVLLGGYAIISIGLTVLVSFLAKYFLWFAIIIAAFIVFGFLVSRSKA